MGGLVRDMRRSIKKHILLFVFIASTLLGLTLYLIPYTRDFGLNFFMEMVGVWITVFLINRILEKKERQKRVVLDLKILRETQSIVASYFSIWKHLVWKYAPDARIENEQDLKKIYPKLIAATSLDDQFDVVSIHDPESWKLFFHNRSIKDCFANYRESLTADINAITNNFKTHIEPELLGCLLEITESNYFRDIASITQNEEMNQVFSEFGHDTNKLSSFLTDDDCHFDKVIELRAYCSSFRARISEFTDVPEYQYNFKRYFANPVVHHITQAI